MARRDTLTRTIDWLRQQRARFTTDSARGVNLARRSNVVAVTNVRRGGVTTVATARQSAPIVQDS